MFDADVLNWIKNDEKVREIEEFVKVTLESGPLNVTTTAAIINIGRKC